MSERSELRAQLEKKGVAKNDGRKVEREVHRSRDGESEIVLYVCGPKKANVIGKYPVYGYWQTESLSEALNFLLHGRPLRDR